MKCLIQRVKNARVEIDGQITAKIDHGLLVFVCAEPTDDQSTIQKAADKILRLRIFGDEDGKMNHSVQQINGGLLVVSQFTLAADTRRGNRPSFTQAAKPTVGKTLYHSFVDYLKKNHPEVQSGVFGADMQVHLINDGPVTIPLNID